MQFSPESVYEFKDRSTPSARKNDNREKKLNIDVKLLASSFRSEFKNYFCKILSNLIAPFKI